MSILSGAFTDAGSRYHGLNQDTYLDSIITIGSPGMEQSQLRLWGIFDGHNMLGEVAAQICVVEFEAYFREEANKQWQQNQFFNITHTLIQNAFQYVNNKILECYEHLPIQHSYPGKCEQGGILYTLESDHNGNKFYTKGHEKRIVDFGTTAAIAILHGSQLCIADVGDSRILIGRTQKSSLQAEFMTVQHQLSDPSEVSRIKLGWPQTEFRDGFVALMDFKNQCYTQLSMTRALGHLIFGKLGVIPDPHYVSVKITKKDFCLILASDGVWDYVSGSEAVSIVADYEDPTEAAKELVKHAVRLSELDDRPPDNATALVVFFQ